MGYGTSELEHNGINVKALLLFFLIFISCHLLLPSRPSADDYANISADRMEYLYQSNTYIANGSVEIAFGDALLLADEMYLDGNTRDAVVIGNVTYFDTEAVITAKRIDINLDTKIGSIYESYVYYKKDNFHLHSGEIRKTGEKTFIMDKATVTTCDAEPPEWHLSVKDISITEHKSITGWHSSFNIGNIPLLYTPYFWAPMSRERETGFLFPSFGYSSTRGYYYRQGFFWAIKDNQDATVYLDYYDQKGIGEGLDYRYLLSPGSNGELWLYHVRDKDPIRSLAEIKSYHNQEFSNNVSGYLKVHAVNEHDYYETMDSTSLGRFGLSSWEPTRFGFGSEERLQKYLQSDMHLTKQYDTARIYLLAQGRQSLEGSSREIPQTLPEIGFILNTQSRRFFSFNMAVKGVNFWREKGQEGMRFDVNPNLYFSYGRILTITQRVGVRETAYLLNEPGQYEDRFSYDLDTTLTTRFFKRYTSFIHIIEPRLAYAYTPEADLIDVPVFDSIDMITETNNIRYSFSNTLKGLSVSSLNAKFILSQSYSLLDTDKPFSPLLAETTVSFNGLNLSVNASYDVDDSILAEFIGSVRLNGDSGFIGVGKNLRRATELDQYTFVAGLNNPIKIKHRSLPISLRGTLWYDVNSRDIQQMNVTSLYDSQCWGLMASFTRKTDEYQIVLGFQFKGLGTARFGFPDIPIVFSDTQGASMIVDPNSGDGYGGPSF